MQWRHLLAVVCSSRRYLQHTGTFGMAAPTMELDFTCGPVTALEFADHYLLAGEGSTLHVYNVQTCQKVLTQRILPGRVIHGLRILEGSTEVVVGVFGEKAVRICQLITNGTGVWCEYLTGIREFEDWIWDMCWLKKDCESSDRSCDLSGDTVALVTAHNTVLQWDWKTGTILHKIQSEEKCILYSALFIGNSWENLVVAAGTVFNQVVIWPIGGSTDAEGRVKVIQRLSGHQGVIFGMHFSSSLMRLCSVSDDRSIRLWQLASPEESNHGNNSLSLAQWESMEYSLIHELYGHGARVWDAKLLSGCIVSVGEDATCCVWSYEGNVIQKFKGHKGKSIWSLAASEETSMIATGGGDTSIRLWKLGGTASDLSSTSDTNLTIPEGRHSDAEDLPRSVCLLGEDSLLVATNNGYLYLYSTVNQSWKILLHSPDYQSYTILAACPSVNLVALGNIHGSVTVFSMGSGDAVLAKEAKVCCGKVFSVNWLNTDENLPQLLTTGPEGKMSLWEVSLSDSELILERRGSFMLPYCKQRWVSAGWIIPDQGIMVCGDRGGTVHTYNLRQKQEEQPTQSFPKIHGKAGVTDICCHDDRIFTSGRDGQYREWGITEGGLQLLNANKAFKGLEWICKMFHQETDLVIAGFHSEKFVLWSVGSNQKLMEVACGGGHRAWDFALQEERGIMGYIKNKHVILSKAAIATSQVILKPSLHGRELTCIKHLLTIDGATSIFATSSEDTLINIVAVSRDSQGKEELEVLKTLQGHISSVRALAVSRSSEHGDSQSEELLLFSAGGRAQMKCWRVSLTKGVTRPSAINSNRVSLDSTTQRDNSNVKSRSSEKCDSERTSDSENLEVDSIEKKSDRTLHAENVIQKEDKETGLVKDNIVSSQKDETGYVCDKYESSQNCAKQYVNHSVGEEDTAVVQGVTKRGQCCSYALLGSHMLSYKGLKQRKPWKKADYDPSPETRFMALTAFPESSLLTPSGGNQNHFVAAACSDGFMRFYRFHIPSKSFILEAQSNSNNHCLLCVGHMIISTTNGKKAIIYAGSTDGTVAFWDVTEIIVKDYEHAIVNTTLGNISNSTSEKSYLASSKVKVENDIVDLGEPRHVIRTNQSGVNAICLHKLNDAGVFLMACGGDDSALTVHKITATNEEDLLQSERVTVIPTAHAAQITGLSFVDESYLVSASIDQRVVLWRLEEKNLQFQCCNFTSIADISGLDSWWEREKLRVAVCGQGLQIITIDIGTRGS